MITDKKLSQLQYYTARNKPIFPCAWMDDGKCGCGDADCKSPGKHPLIRGGFYSASSDFEIVKAWHDTWPEANWAMRTGDAEDGGAGIVAIDIDKKSGGFETWEMLREENPGPIETVTVRTGNGGQHLWFSYPSGYDIRSGAAVLGPGIDIRSNLGYILIPPSTTTNAYRFELSPDESQIEELPKWILTRLNGNAPCKEVKPASERVGDVINQGERHQALLTMAGAMRRVGMTDSEIEQALLAIRTERFADGDHAVTDKEVHEVATWIGEKHRDYMLTDLGNAERFTDQHRHDVRFCQKWESWLIWDGKRWKVDNTAELKRKAFSTIRSIYEEASRQPNEIKRKDVAHHAVASEARARIDNMLSLSKAFLNVEPEELDTDPMLFNVQNGVIDLVTGELLPHDRELMITKVSPAYYDMKDTCPEWDKFINLITGGDQQLALFLQLAAGYTLSGRIDEHCLFFPFGTGQNGKTTFTETIRRMMGDYAKRTDIEALLSNYKQGPTANPYIADMVGARFVLASEIPENRKINESLIKDLTGGDAITARYLFSNPFTYSPVHKLWVFGNYKPKVSGTDWGFWRRMRLIPFNITIPDDIKKPMGEVLKTFESEMPGILTWAVTGCIFWQNQGLTIADAVRDATLEYRNEQDLIQQFIDERCEMHPDHKVEKKRLYDDWSKWCEDSGIEKYERRSKAWVTRQITRRGITSGGEGGHSLCGIRLKN